MRRKWGSVFRLVAGAAEAGDLGPRICRTNRRETNRGRPRDTERGNRDAEAHVKHISIYSGAISDMHERVRDVADTLTNLKKMCAIG